MKTMAYLRISTDNQDLASQKLEIESYAKQRNIMIDEFIEIEISSRKNRKVRKIDELLTKLKRNDRLIVSELSRLSRSIKGVHDIMDKLSRKKVECHIIKQNLIHKGENDINTTIFINAFAQAAQIERDLISQRTKMGLALAKKRGVKLGNPNISQLVNHLKEDADKYAETLRGVLTGFVHQGFTQHQMIDELEKVGIKTRRGCDRWSLVPLQTTLKRLNLKTQRARR